MHLSNPGRSHTPCRMSDSGADAAFGRKQGIMEQRDPTEPVEERRCDTGARETGGAMDAITAALRMEQEAVDFYTQCAGKTKNPVGRRMFLSIAEDEKYHLACATDMQRKKTFTPAKGTPVGRMKASFDQQKEKILGEVAAGADDLYALTVAMKMEEEAIAFYRRAEEQAKTPGEKAFFECLINDEEEHFRIFQNTHSFLSDSGNWYMWDDHSIVEG